MRTSDRDALVAQLIAAGRTCVERGLVLASGGNLSVRLEGRGSFVITESGTWLDRLTPDDFAEISLRGGQRIGGRPSVEWKLHALTYSARPDVHAIIHLHPQTALLVDMLGEPIRLTTLDHQYYLRSVGRTDFLPSGSDELAQAAAEQAVTHDAIVMAHHGSTALGETVEMALRRALNLEEAALMTYRLLLAGNTTAVFPPEYVDRIITV
ncbi:MAG: class II aldolase/adducin family protein [Phycicoccus sp.]|nr:class II aldolase/adducin family protein [Phycicoccus sp.]